MPGFGSVANLKELSPNSQVPIPCEHTSTDQSEDRLPTFSRGRYEPALSNPRGRSLAVVFGVWRQTAGATKPLLSCLVARRRSPVNGRGSRGREATPWYRPTELFVLALSRCVIPASQAQPSHQGQFLAAFDALFLRPVPCCNRMSAFMGVAFGPPLRGLPAAAVEAGRFAEMPLVDSLAVINRDFQLVSLVRLAAKCVL